MKIINGIRCETFRDRQGGYLGRIAIYEQGKRLYSITLPVIRIARGDALQDARKEAHDLTVRNFHAIQAEA